MEIKPKRVGFRIKIIGECIFFVFLFDYTDVYGSIVYKNVLPCHLISY